MRRVDPTAHPPNLLLLLLLLLLVPINGLTPAVAQTLTTTTTLDAWKEPTMAVSRRNLFRGFGFCASTATSAAAWTIDKVEPDETKIYTEAQKGRAPLRILWVGAGNMRGVFKDVVFKAGSEVIALDLLKPDAADLSAVTAFAADHGYQLRFEQGDATKLTFADETFDVVVCSQFLCQDFNPEVVVSELRRVLKPGGRFGFFEDKTDIDEVIVGKVFGERSVIRVQYDPEKYNIKGGVVRKV
jgi:SAM-dependent methyltransferase